MRNLGGLKLGSKMRTCALIGVSLCMEKTSALSLIQLVHVHLHSSVADWHGLVN